MSNHQTSIILASASPRRRKLLAQAGYNFDMVIADIDESQFSSQGLSSVEYSKILALVKAENVAKKFPDALVIAADTVVDFDGEIIGKAEDNAHAEQIVRKLFSRPHKVITGVAVIRLRDGIEIVESDTTIVYPKKMTDRQIAEHIKGGSWRGKAGAYAIQETGDEFVEKIEGSMTNVMGLPMELLERLLNGFNKKKFNHE